MGRLGKKSQTGKPISEDEYIALSLHFRTGQDDPWRTLDPEQAAKIVTDGGRGGSQKTTAEEFNKLLAPRLTGGNAEELTNQ